MPHLIELPLDVERLVLNVRLLGEVESINGCHLAQPPAPLVHRSLVLVGPLPTEGGCIPAGSAELFTPWKNTVLVSEVWQMYSRIRFNYSNTSVLHLRYLKVCI